MAIALPEAGKRELTSLHHYVEGDELLMAVFPGLDVNPSIQSSEHRHRHDYADALEESSVDDVLEVVEGLLKEQRENHA